VGGQRCRKSDLPGGDGSENARLAEKILNGECTNAMADAVLLNAGAGIYLMGGASSIGDGVKIARDTVGSGKAYETLRRFVKLTNS
ncbi:MAG: anthranilate phosphoribosyltransferase, partial [Lachnospiraceae bacterium]|nr:anthranilate phosphoribosyltransferase [Lachnospiraceae bacterium]